MRAYACVRGACPAVCWRPVCVGVGGSGAVIGTSHAFLMSPLAVMEHCFLMCVASLWAEVASSPTFSSINPRSPRHIEDEHPEELHTDSFGLVFG